VGPCGWSAPRGCEIEAGVCVAPPTAGVEPLTHTVRTPEILGELTRTADGGPSPTGAGGVTACGDDRHLVVVSANGSASIPEGAYPQPISEDETPLGAPSDVHLIAYDIASGAFVGWIQWSGMWPFSPQCPYIWQGSAAADACVAPALAMLRQLLPLCPVENLNEAPEMGCPCNFNLLTPDVHPLCVDTDGDGIWETPGGSGR